MLAALSGQLRVGSKIMRVLSQHADDGDKKGAKFQGVRMLCYDASTWTRDNFAKGVEEYNKVRGSEMTCATAR